MPGKTWDEICAEMDETTKKIIQSHEDARISQALATFQKNHPTGDDQLKSITERIKKIEAAKGSIETKFNLKAFALEQCYADGIPFKMIEGDLPHLPDEESIQKKITALKEFAGDLEKNKTNELLAKGFKPNSGDQHNSNKLDIDSLDRDAMAELEFSGALDKILKGG